MDPFQALALGVLQGLTEFLPISSSGHLVLIRWLFDWQGPGLTFDVALHMGTLVAVVFYFWRDLLRLLGGFTRSIGKRRRPDDHEARLFWLLVIASIPAAIFGVLLEEAAEGWLRTPALVASLLIGMGILLIVAEAISRRERLLHHLGLSDAVLIGISQAVAIFPGVSRSGITISAGLFRGFTRDAAARFSFLMSAPIIGGAGIYNLRHLLKGLPADERMAFVIGFGSAAVVGFLAIKLLLYYLQRNSLRAFAYYRFALGLFVLALVLSGSRP